MNGHKLNKKITKKQTSITYLKTLTKYLLLIDILTFNTFQIIDIITNSPNWLYNISQLFILYTINSFQFYSICKNKPTILLFTTILYLVIGMSIFFILIIFQIQNINTIFVLNIISGIARMLCGIFLLVLYKRMTKLENLRSFSASMCFVRETFIQKQTNNSSTLTTDLESNLLRLREHESSYETDDICVYETPRDTIMNN